MNLDPRSASPSRVRRVASSAWAAVLVVVVGVAPALAVEPEEEVDVTAGAVTALSCAQQAFATGDLSLLGSACPLSEVKSGLVIVDVAERQIYVPAEPKRRAGKAGKAARSAPEAKQIAQHQLESAFGGGSIDLAGVVVSVDKGGVATVAVSDFTVNKKKKAGSFKGCL
jgi:hypothetical protein